MLTAQIQDSHKLGCDDLERMPSSVSMDIEFGKQSSKPFQWVDDANNSDDDNLTTDTSEPATPSLAHTRASTPLVVAYSGIEPQQIAITSGVRAWTRHQAYGASDALIKYATASPLLPQQVAEMVSNLSVIARVSLKAAAFFIEVILEAVKNGTGMTLGITRRALISAVGTARAVHSLTSGEAWDAKTTGRALKAAGPSFLSILDKYTAVGIYLIHHTFTLAELFAMGGFQIVGTTLTAGLAAADESVRTIDGIFGSNETSRALASFITLARKEVTEDARFSSDSTVALFNKLTKAVTAFAVLQNSTFKRSAKSMKMRVVYDCTVLGEVESKSWRSLMVGSGNFIRSQPAALLSVAADQLETLSLKSPPRRHASLLKPDHNALTCDSGPGISSSRSRGFLGDGLCLTDIDPSTSMPNGWRSSWAPSSRVSSDLEPETDDASLIADLDFLVGAEDEDTSENSFEANLSDKQLPPHLRQKLKAYTDDELRQGVVLQESSPDAAPRQQLRRIRKTNGANGNRETIYEITTEIIETVETITTVEETRPSSLAPGSTQTSLSPVHGIITLPISKSGTLRRDVTSSRSGTETQSIFEGGRETMLEEDEEWCEIRTTDGQGPHAAQQQDVQNEPMQLDIATTMAVTLPEAPNGTRLNGKGKSEISSKMPYVLKTMTKRLIQKRKTIRRVEVDTMHDDVNADADVLEIESAGGGSLKAGQRNVNPETSRISPVTPVSPLLTSFHASMGKAVKEKDRDRKHGETEAAAESILSKGADLSRGLNMALKRAKHTFKSGQQADSSAQSKVRAKQRHPRAPPSIEVDSPSRTGVSTKSTSTAARRPETAPLTSPRKVKSASKTSAEARSEGSKRNSAVQTTPRAANKELPSIPHRGASQRPLFPSDSTHTTTIPPPSPQGSTKELKRRSRAPSITSTRSFASRTHVSSFSAAGNMENSKHGWDLKAFPKDHLVENLRRFVRYSSAAYGQNFMRILGIGSLDYFFPDTSKHHANVWAFAHHVGIPVDCILLNSFSEAQPLFTEQMTPLVSYIAVDHAAKAVVLTCRGTMGLSDILTDLTCDYETIAVEGGHSDKHYQVHSGMLASTRRLCNENGTVMKTLKLALDDNPEYGLVITGHSLGGGVASMAAVELSCPEELFRSQALRRRANTGKAVRHPRIHTPFVTSFDSGLPPGRPIHAYAYGVPAVASPDLSAHCKGLVTSIIHGHDFIPTLSLGMVRDFKNIAHTLSAEGDSDVAREIITRVLGTYRKRSSLRRQVQYTQAIPEHLASMEPPRPQELPLAEREMQLTREELMKGKTRNLATDTDYQDPNLTEDDLDPFSYSSGGGQMRSSPSNSEGQGGDAELADWLWSLIKTIRADMDSAKLYPPGDVYCIESFPVFVTPRMQADSDIVHDRTKQDGENREQRRAEAHRVIMRYCEDVEKRFSEPVFAKSMMRDHIPTNYELCMSLLWESVMEGGSGMS